MSKHFQLVFEGETLEGFDPDDVRRHVGEHMKLDAARLENLFSGRRVVLRRGVDEERAHRHKRQFASLGGRLLIEPDDGTPPSPPRPPRPAPAPRPELDSPPTTAPMPMQLSEPPVVRSSAPAAPAVLAGISVPDYALVPTAEEAREAQAVLAAQATPAPRGAFMAPPPVRAPRSEPAATPAPSPELHVQAGAGLAEQAPPLLGFRFKGRLSRRGYAQASAVTYLLGYLLLLFVMRQPSLPRIALAAVFFGVLGFYATRLCVLRCHDAGYSGWWSLLLAIPLVGFLVALALAWVPSTDGDNRYGEMPDEGSKTLTTVVTVSCALVVAFALKPAIQAVEHEEAEAAVKAAEGPPKLEPAADRAFHVEYAAAPGHKAFAITKGAFGWKSALASVEEAEEAALAACDEQRPSHAEACEVVHVDNNWLPRWR